MRKAFIVLTLAICLATPMASHANVFASDLSAAATWDFAVEGDIPLYYRLNADSATVTIRIFPEGSPGSPVRTVVLTDPAYVDAGLNNYVWNGADDSSAVVADGTYSFSVEAAHPGFGSWTDITDPDTATYPYGTAPPYTAEFCKFGDILTVDDPSLPQFGRIFLTSAQDDFDGTSTNPDLRTPAGVYMLNSDLSCYNPAGGAGDATTAYAPMNSAIPYPWGQSTATYYPTYGPQLMSERFDGVDGFVVANAADVIGTTSGHSIYAFDVNGDNLIAPLNIQTATPNMGEPEWAALVGSASDRILYVGDWDYNGPGIRGATGASFQDVWAYPIGTTDNDYTGQPQLAFASSMVDAINAATFRGARLVPGTTDVIYLGNPRWTTASCKALICAELWPASAWGNDATNETANSQILWSKTNIEWQTDASSPSVYMAGHTVGLSADGTAVYTGGRYATYAAYDAATGAVLPESGFDAGADYYRSSIDLDVVGNALITNYHWTEMSVLSPPSGENSYTTSYAAQGGAMSVQNALKVNDWFNY